MDSTDLNFSSFWGALGTWIGDSTF